MFKKKVLFSKVVEETYLSCESFHTICAPVEKMIHIIRMFRPKNYPRLACVINLKCYHCYLFATVKKYLQYMDILFSNKLQWYLFQW